MLEYREACTLGDRNPWGRVQNVWNRKPRRSTLGCLSNSTSKVWKKGFTVMKIWGLQAKTEVTVTAASSGFISSDEHYCSCSTAIFSKRQNHDSRSDSLRKNIIKWNFFDSQLFWKCSVSGSWIAEDLTTWCTYYWLRPSIKVNSPLKVVTFSWFLLFLFFIFCSSGTAIWAVDTTSALFPSAKRMWSPKNFLNVL